MSEAILLLLLCAAILGFQVGWALKVLLRLLRKEAESDWPAIKAALDRRDPDAIDVAINWARVTGRHLTLLRYIVQSGAVR